MNASIEDPRFISARVASQPEPYAQLVVPLSQTVRDALQLRDPDFIKDMQQAANVLARWPQREKHLREHPEIGMTLKAVNGSIELDFNAPVPED